MRTNHWARSLSLVLVAASALFGAQRAQAAFTLQSDDLKPGAKIGEDFVYSGFGCSGKNVSPELHWSGAPKGTQSFAVTVYDPDAPTGSGWWHWIAINLPPTTTSLPQGWKSQTTPGAVEVAADFGTKGYGGPCPPQGDKPHRYIFTVHALKTPKLDVAADATHAVVRFMIKGNAIGTASFTAKYGR